MEEFDYTEEQLNELIRAVYDGEVDPKTLPEGLYLAILALITEAALRGFRGVGKSRKAKSVVKSVEYNLARFSAAKVHQLIVDFSRNIFDSNKKKVDFASFKIKAGFVFSTYMSWFETELRTARNQAFGVKQWLSFEENREGGEFLRYVTAGDERVRNEHIELDGTVRHIDDPFWNDNFPPNGWNCRCDVDQLAEGEEDDVTNKSLLNKIVNISVDPMFNFNPAKTGYFFNEETHPYFQVDERYERLKKNDFGLPVPEEP